MEFKKFFRAVFFIFLLAFLVWLPLMYFNVVIDPYGVFFKGDIHFAETANKRHIKILHILRHKDRYDSFLFGSSRVNYFDPAKIAGGNFYNMTYSGGLPQEHLQDIRYLLDNGIRIKKLLIGIDFYSLLENPVDPGPNLVRKKYPETPVENLSFYTAYLFNKPGWDFIDRVIKMNRIKRKSYIEKGIIKGDEDETISRSIVKHHSKKIFTIPYSHYRYAADISENLKPVTKLVELAKQNNIDLVLFINPVYRLTFLNINFTSYFQAMHQLASITGFYDFGGLNAITNNPFYFYEYSHYTTATSDMILERLGHSMSEPEIADFGTYVTSENIDAHIASHQKRIEKYIDATKLNQQNAEPVTFREKAEIIGNFQHTIEYIDGLSWQSDSLIVSSPIIFVQGISYWNNSHEQLFLQIGDQTFPIHLDIPENANPTEIRWNTIVPVSRLNRGIHPVRLRSTDGVVSSASETKEITLLHIQGITPNPDELTLIDSAAVLHVNYHGQYQAMLQVAGSGYLYFEGFAAGHKFGEAAGGVVARAGDDAFLSQLSFPTPDFISRFKNPDLGYAGWGVIFPANALQPGVNQVVFQVLNNKHTGLYMPEVSLKLKVIDDPKINLVADFTPRQEETRYAVDFINGKPAHGIREPVLIAGPAIYLNGWAVDFPAGKPASAVVLKIEDKYFDCEYGIHRPDVAAHFKNDNYEYAGWQIAISGSFFTTGTHAVDVYIVSNNGKAYFYIPENFSINIYDSQKSDF
ncbi:MAG: hypothetical protein ACLFPE_05650 [Bacteroidales bacterium]